MNRVMHTAENSRGIALSSPDCEEEDKETALGSLCITSKDWVMLKISSKALTRGSGERTLMVYYASLTPSRVSQLDFLRFLNRGY